MAAVDWGDSRRRDSYRATLVDPLTLEDVEPVEIVPEECSMTWALDSDWWLQADVALAEPMALGSARDRMVRVYHSVMVGEASREEVMGTLFVDDPQRDDLFGRSTCRLSCYSSLLRLTDDVLTESVGADAGSEVLPLVRQVVAEVGGTLAVGARAAAGDRALRDSRVIPAGTGRLEAARTIASWMGCAIGCDDWGRVTLEPATEAWEVAPSHDFGPAARLDGLAWSGRAETPVNRVLATWSRDQVPDPDDGLGYSMRVVADLPSTDPMAYERVGRRSSYVLEVAQPCTEAELRGQAERYLRAHSGGDLYVSFDCPSVPGLRAGHVVTLRDSSDSPSPVAYKCQVDQIDVGSLGPGCQASVKLRVIGGIDG